MAHSEPASFLSLGHSGHTYMYIHAQSCTKYTCMHAHTCSGHMCTHTPPTRCTGIVTLVMEVTWRRRGQGQLSSPVVSSICWLLHFSPRSVFYRGSFSSACPVLDGSCWAVCCPPSCNSTWFPFPKGNSVSSAMKEQAVFQNPASDESGLPLSVKYGEGN